jgi:hypothetical protein
MGIVSYPFDSQTTTETQYSRFFRELKGTGVLGDPTGSALQVSSPSSGMQVRINTGSAVIRGHYVETDAIETLTLANGSNQARTDLVVMRLNPATNNILPAIVPGTPGGGAPALTQTDTGIFEIALAQVAVGANVGAITSANINDRRLFSPSEVGLWSTANRPASPRMPALGYNISTQKFEFWTGSQWLSLVTLNDSGEINFTFAAGTSSWSGGLVNGSIQNSKLANVSPGTVKARSSNAGNGAPTDMPISQLVTELLNAMPAQSIDTVKLQDGAVQNSKLATVPTSTIKGRIAAGTGAVADIPLTELAVAVAPLVSSTDNTVGNTKLVDMPSGTLKGRSASGTGDPEDLNAATVRTMLGLQALATATSIGGDVTGLTSLSIVSGAVTNAKLATDAVTTTRVADNAVTDSKLADMPTGTIKGRPIGGASGDPVNLVGAQVLAISGGQPQIELVTVQTSATVQDVSVATETRINLNGTNGALVFPAAVPGKRFALELRQDTTGGRTVTWPSSVRWPGGVAPTLSFGASRSDFFAFHCPPGAAVWIGAIAGQNYITV